MARRLLIVEESLRDLKAHWFEYIKTIAQSATMQGYQVEVACHHQADKEILRQLDSLPVFRHARYLDNHVQRLPGERYYGFILHSLRVLSVLWPLLNKQSDRTASEEGGYDHIFVPTVLVHHLLAWWIIMKCHPHRPQHLTLFFVANPGTWDGVQQTSRLSNSPLVRIQGALLRLFRPMMQQGRVTLGVETKGAKNEFEALTQLPFQRFPHPVPSLAFASRAQASFESASPLLFACYGFARYEKGADLLKAAIERVDVQSHRPVEFCIQWVDSFSLPDGRLCNADALDNYRFVRLIKQPLLSDDYQRVLSQTHCMVLPYRNSSYYARLSRIAVECVCLGIPMIYTKGGWLEDVVDEFGAGVGIRDESVDELIAAIATVTENYESLRKDALKKRTKAQQYFSGETFCRLIFEVNSQEAHVASSIPLVTS